MCFTSLFYRIAYVSLLLIVITEFVHIYNTDGQIWYILGHHSNLKLSGFQRYVMPLKQSPQMSHDSVTFMS